MDHFSCQECYQERYRENLPENLFTAEQVRQLDHIAIAHHGIPGFELMSRAASAVMAAISHQWPGITGLQVLCGAGNNGGDGYLVARLASDKNIPVSVLALKDPATLTGDAQQAFQACVKAGVSVTPYEPGQPLEGDVIVDAMLGTGLSGEVRGHYQTAIQQLNNSDRSVCSVDIPSGLCADTGSPLGEAVKAHLTVSFIGLKQGFLTGKGPEYTGQLLFNDLGVPAEVYQEVAPGSRRVTRSSLQGLVKPRPRAAHKGDFGHVLLVGGNHGMPGAITMAAEAAIHCGAGKVSVATRKSHLNALAIRTPEIMATAVKTKGGLKALLPGKTVIVIGPGLGQDEWALRLLKDALASECPLVLDADALNLLSEHPQLLHGRKFPMILTPHPGEMARLRGCEGAIIQKDRFTALKECHSALLRKVGQPVPMAILLKGAGTLIYEGQELLLCDHGNPAMAVAGMGDVLSGIVGALVAQKLDITDAVRLGVWLHASAADEIVADQGEVGLLATQLIPVVRKRLNAIIR